MSRSFSLMFSSTSFTVSGLTFKSKPFQVNFCEWCKTGDLVSLKYLLHSASRTPTLVVCILDGHSHLPLLPDLLILCGPGLSLWHSSLSILTSLVISSSLMTLNVISTEKLLNLCLWLSLSLDSTHMSNPDLYLNTNSTPPLDVQRHVQHWSWEPPTLFTSSVILLHLQSSPFQSMATPSFPFQAKNHEHTFDFSLSLTCYIQIIGKPSGSTDHFSPLPLLRSWSQSPPSLNLDNGDCLLNGLCVFYPCSVQSVLDLPPEWSFYFLTTLLRYTDIQLTVHI